MIPMAPVGIFFKVSLLPPMFGSNGGGLACMRIVVKVLNPKPS